MVNIAIKLEIPANNYSDLGRKVIRFRYFFFDNFLCFCVEGKNLFNSQSHITYYITLLIRLEYATETDLLRVIQVVSGRVILPSPGPS